MLRGEKTFDVIAMGDLILNFAYAGESSEGIALYERQPAGATANMLTQVARLGGRAALISVLGNDEHSRYLFDYEKQCGVDMTNVRLGDLPTRIMFVYYDENNDRYFSDFQMERNDAYIEVDEIDYEMVKSSRYLSVKCMPLSPTQPAAEAMEKILRVARESDIAIAVDAQWRGQSMTSEERAEVRYKAAISEVVKLTDVEMEFYYGETDLLKGTERILNAGVTKLVALTLGAFGCLLRTRRAWVYEPGFRVATLDTTGAGDSFLGALLYSLCRTEHPTDSLAEAELAQIAAFCNACAAYSTQFRGSLANMASVADAEKIRALMPRGERCSYFSQEKRQ